MRARLVLEKISYRQEQHGMLKASERNTRGTREKWGSK
jgi:hypothetical protein